MGKSKHAIVNAFEDRTYFVEASDITNTRKEKKNTKKLKIL